jgi:hypothetical protein
MRRHRPTWNQTLFAWVWAGDDGRPDGPEDDDPADRPPPLRDRVRQRHADRVVKLWGWPVRLSRRPPPVESPDGC